MVGLGAGLGLHERQTEADKSGEQGGLIGQQYDGQGRKGSQETVKRLQRESC